MNLKKDGNETFLSSRALRRWSKPWVAAAKEKG